MVGILVGTKPCGTVVMFEKLYGSELISQVTGILSEYDSKLSVEGKEKLKHLNYDDACHLLKFLKKKNMERIQLKQVNFCRNCQ